MRLYNLADEMIRYLKVSVRSAIVAVAFGLLIFSLLAPSTALAKAKKEDDKAWVLPTHIQLVPMMVPVEGRRTAPITLYLAAANKKFVVNICNYAPRIRDVVLKELSRKPVHVKGRRLVLTKLPNQLLSPVNRVIGNKIIGKRQVKKVFAFAGNLRMGDGAVLKLPRARIDGCQNILRSDLEREKAEAAKKK